MAVEFPSRFSCPASFTTRTSRVGSGKAYLSYFTFLFLALLAGSVAYAEPPPNRLDPKPGDDYDRELLGDPARPDFKGPAGDALQNKLRQELGVAARPEDKPEDPLRQIAKEMRDVVPRLGKRDSGKVTQYLQQQIVADLEKVIEQAKKSAPKGGMLSGGSKPKRGKTNGPRPKEEIASDRPSAAARDSDSSNRKPDKDRDKELREARLRMMDLFRAELRAHPREQMTEAQSEYFLPEYQLEIEDYFRRLSEDQPDTGAR